MKVLIVEPNKHPYEQEIDSGFRSMRRIVGGSIDIIYPFDDLVAIVCNDEARLEPDAEWNRYIGTELIKGTYFVCGIDEDGNLCDLPDDLMEKYKNFFLES